MSDEQQGTLTLDALLGLPGGISSEMAKVDERTLGPASDLLLDIIGAAPEPPDAPLTLETLPTLPKIPLQGPADRPRSSSPKPEPISAVDCRPDAARGVSADEEALAKQIVAPVIAYARKGKHASDRVKERAFGGKHAVRAAQEASAEASARRHAPASASAPESASGPTPKPAPTPAAAPAAPAPASAPAAPAPAAPAPAAPKPAPSPAPAPDLASQSEGSRLERLNALSRKLESEIIAVCELGEQPSDERVKNDRSLPDWSKGNGEASPMFEEHPQSIAEGMKEGLREHYRLVRIKIALGIATSLALVALVLGAVVQCSNASNDADNPAAEAPLAPSENSAPGQNQPERGEPSGEHAGQGTAAQAENRSGEVVYRYLTTDASGNSRTVTESVSFGENGLCETSTMDVEFGDSEGAEAFAQNIRRDYGSAARDVELDGTNVHVEIDTSANRLDREAYEDALRDSVRELAIVKKS